MRLRFIFLSLLSVFFFLPDFSDVAIASIPPASIPDGNVQPIVPIQTVQSDVVVSVLPPPEKLPSLPRTLSLHDAIALALRNTPAVQISELQRILDKFSLEMVLQGYRFQWSPLGVTTTLQSNTNPVTSISAGIGVLQSTLGTTLNLGQTNNLPNGVTNNVLTITQPLLQNFGAAYNRIPYENGIDNEKIARLNFKNSVINAIVNVITTYRALVQAYNNLDVSKQTLVSQTKTIAISKLQLAAGKIAQSDLIQQEASLQTYRLSVVQQRQALRTSYQNFLSSLGLVPSARILIVRKIDTNHTQIPSAKQCVAIALKNNIAYQAALLNLNITKRALITAKNARKWTLNVVGSVTSQNIVGGMPTTSNALNSSIGLNLSVPIDNIQLKQGIVSAQVAIEDATLNLEQQKEDLIRNVMNQLDVIQSESQQIQISTAGVRLQAATLKNAKLKLKYGKSSVFEVTTLETALLSERINLINAQMSYLNSITALYQTLGMTLDRWNVRLKY